MYFQPHRAENHIRECFSKPEAIFAGATRQSSFKALLVFKSQIEILNLKKDYFAEVFIRHYGGESLFEFDMNIEQCDCRVVFLETKKSMNTMLVLVT